MTNSDRMNCILCEGGKRVIFLTESNEYFLSKCISDGNIDEAITIARIAWDKFPELKESADAKRLAETLLKGIVQEIHAQVFTPIDACIRGLNGLMSTLEKNPELIQKCSEETIRNLNQIVSSINGPMLDMHGMLTQFFHKPSVKGSVGEKVLEEIWQRNFEMDRIDELGGPGREDFLVTPYLNTGINRYGDRISVERKSGKQKYTPRHFDDAVRHSIERGATHSIIVYDTQDSLPQKTMIAIEKGVLVAVVDIASGTWKMARAMFGVLQTEMLLKKKKMNEINIQSIQQVATDIETLVEITSNIKGKTAKFKREMETDLDGIEESVRSYQDKLIAAVSGIENGKLAKVSMPEEVKSSTTETS